MNSPFPISTASTSASALWASRGKLDNMTEADMVNGRSAPWSSSGIGVSPGLAEEDWFSLRPVGLDVVGLGEFPVDEFGVGEAILIGK